MYLPYIIDKRKREIYSMKIAFVGKGGSGKSTVSTQFFTHLLSDNRSPAFIDADLNIHAPELLGVTIDEDRHLAKDRNMREIRQYLKGESDKIASANHFYATTPPSIGANLFDISDDNPIIKKYFTKLNQGHVAAVGTYDKEAIGISCYHESLSILENILSFSRPSENEWLVVDMVAGIDAFANSLYMQFDMLVLVVEPTREGVGVYGQYRELAQHVGIENRLRVIANKIDDKDDEAFIKSAIAPEHLIGILPLNKRVKKLRQQGESLPLLLDGNVLEKLASEGRNLYRDPAEYLKLLYDLHCKFVKQEYVVNAVGDIADQIDGGFHY